jgi:hypothetical protein
MINPVSDGIGYFIFIVIVLAIVWIVNLVLLREAGFLMLAIVVSALWLIVSVYNHWFGRFDDSLMLWVLFLIIAASFLIGRIDRNFFNLKPLSMLLAVLLSMNVYFQVWLKDDLRVYLYFRLHQEFADLDFYHWAENSTIKTDWRKIYDEYHGDPRVVGEAIQTLFRGINSKTISNNVRFRDATFNAWSTFNQTHPHPLNFEAEGGIANDKELFAYCGLNEPFMIWWMKLAERDTIQAQYFREVLAIIHQYVNDGYGYEDQWTRYKETMIACKSNQGNSIVFTPAFDLVINTVNRKIAESNQAAND